MAAEHGASLLHDTSFWVLISFSFFVLLLLTKGRKPILDALDGRTNRIKNDLEEAARLRSEAEALLADVEKKHKDAVQTSDRIINDAKKLAAELKEDAEQQVLTNLNRREDQLIQRIAQAEEHAVQELRIQTAGLAARAAERLLQDNLSQHKDRLLNTAIDGLSGQLN